MSDTEDDGRRTTSTVTLRKVKSLLNEERKSIFEDISKTLCNEISDSLKLSLIPEIKHALSAELKDTLTVSIMAGIEQVIDKKFSAFDFKIKNLEESVLSNTNEISNIRAEIEEIHTINANQVIEIAQLKHENTLMKNQISTQALSTQNIIGELEERVEERTNRSLRQTMTFRGIKEIPNEKWSDTKRILAESLAETCDVTYEDAEHSINRAHRSGRKSNGKPRVIYANFCRWDVTQDIISAFRFSNMNYPGFSIYADYKYGPRTSVRRVDALTLRKSLKADGEIVAGYIQYPARLMVKYNIRDDHYTMHKDFSKAPVDFSKFKRDHV